MLKNCCHGSQRTHRSRLRKCHFWHRSLYLSVCGFQLEKQLCLGSSGGECVVVLTQLETLCTRIMNFMTVMSTEVLNERTDLSFGLRVPRSIRVDEMAGTGAAWVSFKMAAKGKLRFNPWDGMAYITWCPLFRQAILVRFPEEEHPLLKRRLHCNAKRSKRETVSVSRSHIKTGKIRSHQTQPMSLSMGVVGLSQNLEASISQ